MERQQNRELEAFDIAKRTLTMSYFLKQGVMIMIRNLVLAALVGSLIGACTSTEKKEEDSSGTAPTSEGAISSSEMSFDPSGSDSGNIAGLTTIHFDYDKANLTSEARRILGENAEWIRGHGAVSLQIEGHCDERGSIEYNLSLGQRRAKAVKDYLVGLGLDGSRLSIISYGKEKPLNNGDTEEAYAANRRANFVPLPQ